MSEENRLGLLGYGSSRWQWPMVTSNISATDSSYQVSHPILPIPYAIDTCNHREVQHDHFSVEVISSSQESSQSIIDKMVIPCSSPLQLSNSLFLSSDTVSDRALHDGNNFSLRTILMMSYMDELDNPYEPRPIHPFMETKVDSIDVGTHGAINDETLHNGMERKSGISRHRRMSVEHVLEILSVIPSINDDDNIQSMLTTYETDEANFYQSLIIDNHVTHLASTDSDEDTMFDLDMSDVQPMSERDDIDELSAVHTDVNHLDSLQLSTDGFKSNSIEVSSSMQYERQDDVFGCLPPATSLFRFKRLMSKSRRTQNLLQEWDKKNGLPRSHCCTMMHTNRSRRQLDEGRILPKWNGSPLIRTGNETANQIKRKNIKKKNVKKMSKIGRQSTIN